MSISLKFVAVLYLHRSDIHELYSLETHFFFYLSFYISFFLSSFSKILKKYFLQETWDIACAHAYACARQSLKFLKFFLELYNLIVMENLITTNKELSKYIAEFEADVKVTDYNIREKSMTSSAIWAKWLSYLYHEKENLDKIQETKQKIIAKKMSENKNMDSVLRLKSEDKIASSDDNIKKLNALSKMTQTNIDYIERALGILAGFTYSIKNVIEVLKLNLTH